jgi:bifunctional non-homologous end joining protein LigD
MLTAARAQGLEGVVAKRKDSRYEIGKRSGSWAKYRLNSGQELVIGGYIPGVEGIFSLVIPDNDSVDPVRGQPRLTLHPNVPYVSPEVARVRNGFVPASRRQIFARLKPLIISKCPFVNLMDKCVWVRPEIVAQIEFLEWTESNHLRHSKFAGIREDKDPRKVIKEHAGQG